MSRSRGSWSRVGWIGALALLSVGVAAAQEEAPVEFRFQPVDGEVWIKEMHDVQLQDMGEMAPYQETETRSKIEIRYEALPDGGWLVRQKPLEGTTKVNGEAVENPALAQTIGQEIRIYLTSEGDAVRVEGFKEFMRKLERALPPATYARMRKTMSVEGMTLGELRDWDRLLEFIGHPVRPGEQWRVIDQAYISGGGVIGTDGYYRFDGWTEIDDVRGFKVTYEWDASGQVMASIGDDHTRSISRRTTDEIMPRTNVELRGTLVRVFVPETGQLLYEVYDQSYELPLQMGGANAHMEQRHTHRYRKAG